MKKKRAGFAALLCTLLIVLDQITKALTVSVLKLHDIVVIPGVLTLTYVETVSYTHLFLVQQQKTNYTTR